MAILKRQLRAALNVVGVKEEKALLAGFGAPTLDNLSKRDYAKMAAKLRDRGVQITAANYTETAKGLEKMTVDKYFPQPGPNKHADAAAKESNMGDKLHAVAESRVRKKVGQAGRRSVIRPNAWERTRLAAITIQLRRVFAFIKAKWSLKCRRQAKT